MDVFYAYTYGTAGWLAMQAVPMLVMPKVIITMLSPYVRNATDLEIYFTRTTALGYLTIACVVLFFTGTIPLSSGIREPVSMEDNDPKAPYAVPIVRLTMIFHSAFTIYYYIQYLYTGQVAFAFGVAGAGVMAAMGMWCIMFGTSGGRISKTTGQDKRTSNFPFSNSEAYKRKVGKKRF